MMLRTKRRKQRRNAPAYDALETRRLLAGLLFGSNGLEFSGPVQQFESGGSVVYPAVNLAQFQETSADSSSDGTRPEEATDGIVSNDSRWWTNGSGPHWLEVELTVPYPVGSAQLFLGKDDAYAVSSFEVQHHDGDSWQTLASVSGNSATDLNLVFFDPVVDSTRFRFYSTAGTVRIKEFVLLPPAPGGGGHPLGTGVNLNLASQRAPIVSSVSSTNYAIRANDGFVDDDSRWLSANSSGPHTIELQIPTVHEVGSLHLYSGFGNGSPLADFDIHYANGSGWVAVPGGTVSSGTINGNSVTGNNSTELVVNFSESVSAEKIRLTFTQAYGRIREIVVLPANVVQSGSNGYEIGTSVEVQPRPRTNFRDFHDSWYRLAARTNDNSLISTESGSSQADSSTTDAEKRFQLLYSYSLDAYRIRNADSGKAIEVEDASLLAGAAIVEGDYSAAPHQLWRLEETQNGYYQIVNVWSGMVLETDSGSPAVVTQGVRDPSNNPVNRQEWIPFHQADYFKKGTGGWVGQYNTGWAYDWARSDPSLGKDQFYAPMQHREGWPNLETLHRRYADWNNDVQPAYLLGFNEPDRPDQANMGVGRAIELWPQLLNMDVPLLSPAPAQGGEDWWLNDFMDRADDRGYRVDYAGGHWYSGPSVDNLFAHIDDVQNKANGKRVWLTEFSVVDWSGGSGNWSEETNYNFILEFLWRAESKANLGKYALFLFSGSSPQNPWTLSNPRSNFFSSGSLTPFGKAFASWDGDKTIYDDAPYLIHNRNARHRLRNAPESTGPSESWIRREDASVQWQLRDAGNGSKYIDSAADGRRLRYDGATLDFAPAGTTGPEVEWTIQREQYGWHNIIHSDTGEYLRLVRQNNSNNAPTNQYFEMVSASAAAGYTSTDWWFVKPHNPVSLLQVPFGADFGPSGSAAYQNYLHVDGASSYSSTTRFGWLNDLSSAVEFTTQRGNDLVRDGMSLRRGTFVADVPDGQYQVNIHLGVVKKADAMQVVVEGLADTFTPAAGPNVVKSYLTTVNDGQLTVYLDGLAGLNNKFRLSGISVDIVSSRPADSGGLSDGAGGKSTGLMIHPDADPFSGRSTTQDVSPRSSFQSSKPAESSPLTGSLKLHEVVPLRWETESESWSPGESGDRVPRASFDELIDKLSQQLNRFFLPENPSEPV